MTTINQIREAWDDAIFDHATVRGYTTAINHFDVPNLESAASSGLFYYDAEINFFSFVVTRTRRDGLTGRVIYEFSCRLRYYRENEPSGDNFKSISDRLETVDSLVRSELGNSWSSTVDYYEPGAGGIRAPELIFLENKPVWVGEVSYTGFKSVSI